ncbi:hypothetical protein GCM10007860_15790 [Chitiniphilus shinanonensis]|uniref:Uncharacterized protein n=1 Tax=Chitiniphilus shinanonensis TaxID=553088 RepID=A0ABQ6BW55_9NEIS|nr:hypothetical protein [Chitiniphilus shinanonensis]GLS04432.1 hypothetical protein GCM10007860_15790 [Chitiniphilus shinanonensis]
MADLDPLVQHDTAQHDACATEETVVLENSDDAQAVDWFTLQVWE